ncbi:MAG: hypothetical protein ACM3SQ_13460, partial [Betaproteobacteria bacterium]
STILLATAAIGAGSAAVARAGDLVVAKVPFAFMVHGELMPAGRYVVTDHTMDAQGIVTIESANGRRIASTITVPWSPSPASASGQPQLVFDKVDNQYFLVDVGYEGGSGREIPLSSANMMRQAMAMRDAHAHANAG